MGVLLVEVVGHLDGIIKIECLTYHGSRIIAVAGPVYHATLRHEEETLGVDPVEAVDGHPYDVGLGEFALLAVQTISQGLTVSTSHDEIIAAHGTLGMDDLRVVAVVDVGIEGSRCGMVRTYRGGDAHSQAFLLGSPGDALHRVGELLAQSQGSILRLVACSQGCAAGCGVGYAVGGTVGSDQGRVGEGGKAEWGSTVFAFLLPQEYLCGIDLVHTHAVSNEIEDVLGLS